jgi:hypothetical protein
VIAAMIRVVTLVAVLLLAQSIDDAQSRRTAPAPSGAHLDRHIDAHIEPREGTPAAAPGERPSRETPPPPPAVGTTGPDPSPPAIQLFRDPLYRDWR